MSKKLNPLSVHNQIAAFILAILLLIAGSARASDNPITLESLLNEMASRQSIARLSDPPYACKQTSSHDHQKTDPANPATWHSNHDYEQFIRTEKNDGRNEWVIMEHQGPGAITRMWLPLLPEHDKQIIRFYLDGSPTPAISVPFNQLLSGYSFVKPPLAYVACSESDLYHQHNSPATKRGVGGDLYLPIPFAKSCKITLDQLPFYYIIDYRAYEPATTVRTFTMADFDSAKPAIDRAAQSLLSQNDAAPSISKQSTLAPGDELVLDLPPGSAAVQKIQVTLPPNLPQSIRSIVLTAAFDDEPAIWCPLSEFFGGGVHTLAVADRFRTVNSDGSLTTSWIMPYQRSGRLTLKNLGSKPITLTLAAATMPWQWDDRSMYFHATWHCQLAMHTRPMFDWNYVDLKGQGLYVGDTLTVFSPVDAWYGEGDERIYIDGEKFPSHIGTGTEDYYGYAWGMASYFSSPFMSMPQRDSTDNWVGYTTTSRLRMLDAIPFQSSLSHNMEIWNWADTHVDYAVANFWYARPGAGSNRLPQPEQAATPIHDVPPNPNLKRAGAIECETLPVAGHSPNLSFQTQDVSSVSTGRWSEGKHLFIQATKIGDYIELKIPTPSNDPRKVTLFLTKSFDYGILHITLNGKPAAADFDAYNAAPTDSGPVELGTFTPVDNTLVLRVEVAGSDPAAHAKYFFGLDCITLAKPQ